jgi:hypothetical protein
VSDVAVAFFVSCLLISLPVLSSMIVVKHAGVTLSGPRYTPLDDNMRYVRWNEGHLAAAFTAMRGRAHTYASRPDPVGSYSDPCSIAVWEIPAAEDVPIPLQSEK